ncbi:hypothetical protein ABZ371_31155, partial [Streptomyces sp. NPDC005899]|uniref:hypothetical protein n=1 Tax=Streptomyces sp. NPDC005899 TaxID=3155716 RepID=UPI0033D443AC
MHPSSTRPCPWPAEPPASHRHVLAWRLTGRLDAGDLRSAFGDVMARHGMPGCPPDGGPAGAAEADVPLTDVAPDDVPRAVRDFATARPGAAGCSGARRARTRSPATYCTARTATTDRQH